MWEDYTDKYKAFKLVALPIAMFGSVASLMSIAFIGDISGAVKVIALGGSIIAVFLTGVVGFAELVSDARQREAKAARDAALLERIERIEARIDQFAPARAA